MSLPPQGAAEWIRSTKCFGIVSRDEPVCNHDQVPGQWCQKPQCQEKPCAEENCEEKVYWVQRHPDCISKEIGERQLVRDVMEATEQLEQLVKGAHQQSDFKARDKLERIRGYKKIMVDCEALNPEYSTDEQFQEDKAAIFELFDEYTALAKLARDVRKERGRERTRILENRGIIHLGGPSDKPANFTDTEDMKYLRKGHFREGRLMWPMDWPSYYCNQEGAYVALTPVHNHTFCWKHHRKDPIRCHGMYGQPETYRSSGIHSTMVYSRIAPEMATPSSSGTGPWAETSAPQAGPSASTGSPRGSSPFVSRPQKRKAPEPDESSSGTDTVPYDAFPVPPSRSDPQTGGVSVSEVADLMAALGLEEAVHWTVPGTQDREEAGQDDAAAGSPEAGPSSRGRGRRPPPYTRFASQHGARVTEAGPSKQSTQRQQPSTQIARTTEQNRPAAPGPSRSQRQNTPQQVVSRSGQKRTIQDLRAAAATGATGATGTTAASAKPAARPTPASKSTEAKRQQPDQS